MRKLLPLPALGSLAIGIWTGWRASLMPATTTGLPHPTPTSQPTPTLFLPPSCLTHPHCTQNHTPRCPHTAPTTHHTTTLLLLNISCASHWPHTYTHTFPHPPPVHGSLPFVCRISPAFPHSVPLFGRKSLHAHTGAAPERTNSRRSQLHRYLLPPTCHHTLTSPVARHLTPCSRTTYAGAGWYGFCGLPPGATFQADICLYNTPHGTV